MFQAGSSYIAPLVAGGIISPLLATLSPENSPPRLVMECLRTLVTITSRLRNDPIDAYRELNDVVSDQIVEPQSPTLELLARMLRPDWIGSRANELFLLTLQLIHFVADGNERRQKILVSAGILDLLATMFAYWVASNQRIFRSNDADLKLAFPYAPSRSSYPHIVRAITSIIGDSAYQTSRFITCRDMLVVFPETPEMIPSSASSMTAESQETQLKARRWDRFLPKIYSQQARSESSKSPFPALTSSRQQAITLPDLLAWLIHMARSTIEEERIVTLLLLATVLNAANLNIRYEKHLARLVVPLLTQAIAADGPTSDFSKLLPLHGAYEAITSLKLTLENSNNLQTAAHEAKALECLCYLLKKTFDPATKGARPVMWSPNPNSKPGEMRAMNDPNRLGPHGFRQETACALFVRASAMSALSSLAEKEDKFRRAIIDGGVMQCIVDSLTARAQLVDDTPHTDESGQKYYYPRIVLIAAMKLLVTLSRSVGMLRTSLIDAKVALPVLDLARHEDMAIRLQATDALTNMLLQFSPMKEVCPKFSQIL
jgi:hypothetical protein